MLTRMTRPRKAALIGLLVGLFGISLVAAAQDTPQSRPPVRRATVVRICAAGGHRAQSTSGRGTVRRPARSQPRAIIATGGSRAGPKPGSDHGFRTAEHRRQVAGGSLRGHPGDDPTLRRHQHSRSAADGAGPAGGPRQLKRVGDHLAGFNTNVARPVSPPTTSCWC